MDPTGKMSGRGAYLCAARDCWERGTAGSVLEQRLHLAEALPDEDLTELREAVLALLLADGQADTPTDNAKPGEEQVNA